MFNFEEVKKSIISGILISIGGCVFLACANNGLAWVGAFFFSAGLFTICEYGYNLYTGKVGYIGYRLTDVKYILFVAMIFALNLLTTFLIGILVGKHFPNIREQALKVFLPKLEASFLKDFISSIFCGILMFLAVDTWKRGKIIGVFLYVPVFILCGFDHCVANSFYNGCALADHTFTSRTIIMMAIFSAGNGVGGMLFPLLTRKVHSSTVQSSEGRSSE